IPAKNISDQEQIRQIILEGWKAGKIVAIKGIGGYMLTCDAHHQVAIQTLRQRKNRPSKPLAVMFPDLDALKAALHCPEEAERLLEGPIAPIVILPQKPSAGDALCLAEIAPGMNTVGAMIPYAPAFAWLLSAWGRPIIATSGNQSGSGILYQDENIHQALGDIADLIVVHNREITFPQDDSVISFGQHPETQIWLRRSRGLAPGVRIASPCVPELPTLAMGADLKACFALNPHGRVIASPYLGDLQHFRPQQTYRLMLTRIQQIQQFSPQVILTDAHPGYASCSLGQEIANQLKIPRHQVQHHEAHFAALLGEHGLCQAPGPVLGFVWDGTGYGSDGQIWGGEVFSYTHGKFRRDACLRPFPQLLGDKMSAEPRLSALSLASSVKGLDMAPVRAFFSPQEWSLYSRLIQRKPPLMTSSMGRLFDGVGAWLLKKPLNHYEGEAAILLEQLARRWEGADSLSEVPAYPILLASKPIDWRPMIREILEDLRAGVSTHFIAYRFHWSLVHLIRMLGRASSSERWGFTGGVFQNSLLGDLIREHLSQEAELYFHQVFPPNDEHLAFGQLVHHHITQSFSSVYSQPQVHVSSHTR
ncbi:MAG: Sua5/YciO/YrdC/YwlC family protein, partial [Bacteroidota bacterium]